MDDTFKKYLQRIILAFGGYLAMAVGCAAAKNKDWKNIRRSIGATLVWKSLAGVRIYVF